MAKAFPAATMLTTPLRQAQAHVMPPRHDLSLLAAALIGAVGGWGAGGLWASDPGPKVKPAYLSAKARDPFVQDAMRRWAEKDGISVEKAMEGRSIDIVMLPDRNCVSFGLADFDVGGVPTYCYRPNTTRLIWEDSDVE